MAAPSRKTGRAPSRAPSRKASSRAGGGRRASGGSLGRSLRRITALFLLGGGLALGYLAGGAIVRLDQIVVSRFEGQRFRVPSRVLSAPTILYPGADWKRIDLPGALARLGYRESAGDDLAPGQMRWGGDRVRIHLRAFDHPSRPEPSRDILISLSGSQIEEIRDVHARRELGAVLLEPELVGSYYGPDREQRELVRIGEVPRHLVDAILAVEDQRFDRHHGIDPWRIVGALWANLRAGSIRQGGSTLTQQLVKNFFLTPERTLRRKLEEATMALLVEGRYDKDSILECYLNEIYLGQRGTVEVHGIGEASRLYFGKPARELDLAESALLAAIIPGPNRISPHRDPERTRARRNLVLDLMEQQGRIDPASAEAARAQPIHVARVTPEPAEARYFLDVLRRQLPQVYDSDVLTTEGMRIYSSLDLRLQKLAAAALREGIASLEKRYPKLVSKDPQNALQGCLVALRPQTGEVLALVGGRDYGTSQFDRCTQARRQAGSVFKPFVYLAALEPTDGGPAITLASQLDDAPLSISTPSGPWRPANFDRAFHGTVSVRAALERSMNVATARLAQNVGIERVADLARRSGIESPLALVPSLALGVADVAPIEIARAYATIANGGIRPDIRTFEDVVDAEGDTLARRDIEFERVLDAGTAYLTTSLLEGVIDHGTGAAVRAAGLRGPIAGKTGTTDQERDAWFAGFTPELVVVVWVGFDAPRSIGLSGSSAALPIWARFVRDVTGGEVRGAFLPPPEVISVDIEPGSGALALSGCPERKPELFLLGTEPTRVCPARGVFEHASEPGEGPRSRPAPARRRGFLDWLRDVL